MRVTFPDNMSANPPPLRQALAERFFLCQDDLVIPVPKDKSERPRQFMTDTGAHNVAVPTHPADQAVTTGTYLLRQVQGDYSWMFTVTPLAPQPDFTTGGSPGTPYLNAGVGEYYSVSVAVFYKRTLPTSGNNGEPVGQAAFFSSPSLGGGDVTLTAASPAALDVKQNEWILLGGYTNSTPVRYVLRWYRIVALGDIAAGPSRQATLAGPDWDLTTPADVVLYRGVVDVHTTTMKLTTN